MQTVHRQSGIGTLNSVFSILRPLQDMASNEVEAVTGLVAGRIIYNDQKEGMGQITFLPNWFPGIPGIPGNRHCHVVLATNRISRLQRRWTTDRRTENNRCALGLAKISPTVQPAKHIFRIQNQQWNRERSDETIHEPPIARRTGRSMGQLH
jgi:hypothetical protein